MGQPILVTGSAGFIGSHVCDTLAHTRRRIVGLDVAAVSAPRMFHADVRCPNQLRHVASIVRPNTVVHLAAKAEVVIPFDELADLMATNVNGTINVLDAMRPERIVLASSSAVYGNASGHGARARWSCVGPVGAYGISKAAAEFACAEWVRTAGGVAVSLRFGNVIGKRCRGLIAYLVEHAIAHPRGDRPALLRGDGRIVRDYVPIGHVARAIELAIDVALPRGSAVTFNVGSGRGMTNRAVATIVQRVLATHGLTLTVEFGKTVAPGEAWRLVLDTTATTRKLGLPAPSEQDVTEAIEEAALDCLVLAH